MLGFAGETLPTDFCRETGISQSLRLVTRGAEGRAEQIWTPSRPQAFDFFLIFTPPFRWASEGLTFAALTETRNSYAPTGAPVGSSAEAAAVTVMVIDAFPRDVNPKKIGLHLRNIVLST